MTPLTPSTLVRHELIGLSVRVADAPNEDLVDLAGRVVGETTQTLRVERDGGDVAVVPKRGTTLEFALDEGCVTVEGERLVARPARRSERTGGSTWHSD